MSAAVEVTPATAAAPAAAASPSADSSAAPSSAASAPSSLAAAPRPHGSALVSRTVALSGDQSAYLALMTERYKLGSIDKTARCLVNYADKDGDHRFIFENIRCRKCGIKFPKASVSLSLYPWQWDFLDRMRSQYKIRDDDNNGKALRCLLDFTQMGRYRRGMSDDEQAVMLTELEKEIFTKIRCNDASGTCTHQH